MVDLREITIHDSTANPAPLGLMGFGLTTILLNLHNAGFYELNSMILAMGVFYGGLAQVIAGLLDFRKGNEFGAPGGRASSPACSRSTRPLRRSGTTCTAGRYSRSALRAGRAPSWSSRHSPVRLPSETT